MGALDWTPAVRIRFTEQLDTGLGRLSSVGNHMSGEDQMDSVISVSDDYDTVK